MRPRIRSFRLTLAASVIVIGVIMAALMGDISFVRIPSQRFGRAELSEVDVLLTAFLFLAIAFAVDHIRAGVETASESRTGRILETALDAYHDGSQRVDHRVNAQVERSFAGHAEVIVGNGRADRRTRAARQGCDFHAPAMVRS